MVKVLSIEHHRDQFKSIAHPFRYKIRDSAQMKYYLLAIVALVFSVILIAYFFEKDNFRGAVAANGVECAEIGK